MKEGHENGLGPHSQVDNWERAWHNNFVTNAEVNADKTCPNIKDTNPGGKWGGMGKNNLGE